ncbi:MAG: hypothetical protein IT457_05105 [Planctomycetes bacterium]|nr:hypothetical protein [Planctomycetota bacterium]
MDLSIGRPATGAEFFPRPDVIARLERALGRSHVSFMAPRRTGKTSVLMHLEAAAPEAEPRWRINLERFTSPSEWVEAMLVPFVQERPRWRRLLGVLEAPLRRIEGLEISGTKVKLKSSDWRRPAEELLGLLRTTATRATFLLDEFPILVAEVARRDLAECRAMLRWFREWRQEMAGGPVRFLVTGSIGLDGVVRRLGLADTVNDFEVLDLPPLGAAEARAMLVKLGADNGVAFAEGAIDAALAQLGPPWPYFLQLLVAELQDATSPVDVALVERTYRERLVAGPRNKYVEHMWDRLGLTFDGEAARLAGVLLDALCARTDGLLTSELRALAGMRARHDDQVADARFGHVLDVLRHDGYLVQRPQDARWVFFSNLLRDYWSRRSA